MTSKIFIDSHWLMFKTEELWKEWEARKLDPRLYGIIMAQARFVYATMYPSIMEITSIYREKLTSVHGHWRGVDWLMRDRPPTTHMMIVDWTNKFFPYQKAGHDTCLYHNAGSGLHMHNQVCSIEEVR